MQFSTNRSAPKVLLAHLKTVQKSPTTQAYEGMALAMQAKGVFNPVLKLSRFISATKKIDNAIQTEPHNIEIRFIRYVLQKNTPAMVGYNQHINSDLNKILELLASVQVTNSVYQWLPAIINELCESSHISEAQRNVLSEVRKKITQYDGASSTG